MDTEKIYAVHSMLQLIYHRNKNQHGKARWWRWLSVLKRITGNLVLSIDCIQSHSRAGGTLDLYKQCLAIHIVPRCYLAFSTVVADGQFSTLGTVLLGTLARLIKAIEIVKDKFAAQPKSLKAASSHVGIVGSEDIGEVLSRNNDLSGLNNFLGEPRSKAEEENQNLTPKSEKTMDMATKNKKRKKKKDAIDNLFDTL
ncbi:hypothetical protein BDV28DRAFT_106726 [Aspergillus coremiiformis]|uniref:RNase MRP protein 1 RNA binding domain-containing protein n=1 Tax=Aspergillus coremiiformis TaxID=138285 RepID=A0A5N6YWW6_9EURO|nr:hypothetical protein BDV28DRAFT_106726 [Aspergillus coremiiformis]